MLIFIDIERRTVFLAGVTANPIGAWVTQQARNLLITLEDQGRTVRFRVRDRDAKFVGPFDEVMKSIGARVILTPVRSPRANAFAERFVRTARSECLDWLLIRGELHLDRVLREFVEHYNNERPHRGTDLEVSVAYSALRKFTNFDRGPPSRPARRPGPPVPRRRVALRSFPECGRFATVGRVAGLNLAHASPPAQAATLG